MVTTVLVQIRRREFLVLGAAIAAMTCGGEAEESSTSGPTDDDETTGGAPTTGETDGTTTAAETGTGTGVDVCVPHGRDSGLVVADLAVGACADAPSLNDVIVLRDELGFYAMSNRCTHMGCRLDCPVDGVSTCNCHGSQFDANGEVLLGPAKQSLLHYLVSFDCVGGEVRIFVDEEQVVVDRTTRVVPA